MLTRVMFLVFAVSFYPEDVVYVWAIGHCVAGLLFVLGSIQAFSFIFYFKFSTLIFYRNVFVSYHFIYGSIRKYFPSSLDISPVFLSSQKIVPHRIFNQLLITFQTLLVTLSYVVLKFLLNSSIFQIFKIFSLSDLLQFYIQVTILLSSLS